MATSRESSKRLDAEAQANDPFPTEILSAQEFQKKGPVRILSILNISGNLMTDVKKNEWERVGPARGGSDARRMFNGHYAKREANGTLTHFPNVECPPLSTDIVFIEDGSDVEWKFQKKGEYQIYAEEKPAA